MARWPQERISIGAGYAATLREIQAVWAAVSRDPAVTLRALACRTGMRRTRIRAILAFLEGCGYLGHAPYCNGRTVLIPFVEVWNGSSACARDRARVGGRRRLPGEPAQKLKRKGGDAAR